MLEDLLEELEHGFPVAGHGIAQDLIDDMQSSSPDAAIILVTAQGTVETAAAARTFNVLANEGRRVAAVLYI